MANPWNSSTAYPPISIVSYNGLDYVRSSYPSAATSGTPPNVEMSVDIYGVPIRTWTLKTISGGSLRPAPTSYYFRLDFPENYDSPGYAGLSRLAGSAYDGFTPVEYGYGLTGEYDQFKNNASPIPDNPVCPALKCGVARQFDGLGEVKFEMYTNETSDPRKYNVFLTFNHPLYFRRIFYYRYKISVTTYTDPDKPPVTVINTISGTYVPDDRNFAEILPSPDYYTLANSIFTIVVPEDGPATFYNLFSGAVVTSIESND
jgi:hypothetical protein